MGGASFWTDERVAELTRLWVDEKLSGAEVAKRLGLEHRNAVMGKVHRLGLTRRNGEDATAAPDAAKVAAPKTSRSKERREPATEPAPPVAAQVPSPEPETPAVAEPPQPEPPKAGGIGGLGLHPVMRLKERHCRWPIGDPQSPDFRFCCRERHGGTPYCRAHAEAAYEVRERNGRPSSRSRAA